MTGDAEKLRAHAKAGRSWQRSELTDVTAKVVIYDAFVEGKLEAPKHLARTVHDIYFEPKYEEFLSTPTETQSISENDFECLASTCVKSPLNAMFEHTKTRYPQTRLTMSALEF